MSVSKQPERPILSYRLRAGRTTRAQARALKTLWPRFGWVPTPESPFSNAELFGNDHPLFLEIGFGDGESLLAMAQDHPERNYLGAEVHRPGVGHLLLRLEAESVANVRIICRDAIAVLQDHIAPASLAGICLFFPDPWPKKRHRKRRIVRPETLELMASRLAAAGLFCAATDWLPYAEQMMETLSGAPQTWENLSGPGQFAPRPAERPLTKFERRGKRLGHPVRDLVFRRRPSGPQDESE